MSKFKEGDKVKIVFHPDEKFLGLVGVITEVVDINDVVMISDDESKTTGLYKVNINGYKVPNYAEDDCIELIEEDSK